MKIDCFMCARRRDNMESTNLIFLVGTCILRGYSTASSYNVTIVAQNDLNLRTFFTTESFWNLLSLNFHDKIVLDFFYFRLRVLTALYSNWQD